MELTAGKTKTLYFDVKNKKGTTARATVTNKSNSTTTLTGVRVDANFISVPVPSSYVNSTNLPATVKIYSTYNGVETQVEQETITLPTEGGSGATTAAEITDFDEAVETAIATPITEAKARANHTGTQTADTLTDGTTNKVYLATERTKLSGVATGATANDTDANLKNRANHTGTQSADTLIDGTTNKAYTAAEKTRLTALPDLDSSGHFPATLMRQQVRQQIALRRTNAKAETYPRNNGIVNIAGALTASKTQLVACYLLKDTVVTNIVFTAGGTGGATLTHTWFGLFDAAFNIVMLTADDTTATWTQNTERSLALTTPYTVTADALFYLSINVGGTTMPTLAGTGNSTNGSRLADLPVIAGQGNGTPVTPGAQTNITTIAAGLTGIPYVYVT